jgi:hypothetical protein
VDQCVADYNNINFTIFRDMLPLMEGAREPGKPLSAIVQTALAAATTPR